MGGKLRDWEWQVERGNFDGGPNSLTTETADGMSITVTLQQNEDGVLVCSGLNIQVQDQSKAPANPINSRFFQLLGLGEILKSARTEYLLRGDFVEETYQDMESEHQTRDWPYSGSAGHPDQKYAHLAYMYVRFVSLGKENPIDELAKHMNCDRETASSRIAEARNRGLLTRPIQGIVGGRLTSKAKKILGIKEGKS
jgi:hypothetical protein